MISVVCPILNEEGYIEAILESFHKLAPDEAEFLLIDGGSQDATKDIIGKWLKRDSRIKLLHNPKKHQVFGLNIGIKESKGDVIVRWDAHTQYDENYLQSILKVFNETGADIVGGACRFNYKSRFQKLAGLAMATSFGIGNSSSKNIDFEGYTDSITFGAWKKDVFEDVGLFNESFLYNEDDEFHFRAVKKGKKIFQSKKIKLWYYPRNNAKALAKQFYNYGKYKPAVLFKTPTGAKVRHFIPAVFLIYLLILPLIFNRILIIPILFYIMLLYWYSINVGHGLKEFFILLVIFPVMHISYGLGFILGLPKMFFLNKEI